MTKLLRLRKSLALPAGAWQLFWIGRLVDLPSTVRTPHIAAYPVNVLLVNGRIERRSDEVRCVELPVSDLAVLPLGTVFDNDVILPPLPLHQAGKEQVITVDFTREKLKVFGRIGSAVDGAPLLKRSAWSQTDDREYEGLLLSARGEEGGPSYLFPCTTIFQFFWARSSKWAQLMVDGRFLDYNRYVFDARRSYLSGDGKTAMIWLRQWMRDADAPLIATLAFNEYALERGCDIYRYLAQPPRIGERRCIRALPPYEGKMSLAVIAHRVETNEGPAMLVHGISSCDYTPSIRSLEFDRDNDGRRLDDAISGDAKEKIPMQRNRFGGPPETVVQSDVELVDSASSSQLADIEITAPHMTASFPNLARMVAVKSPQIETPYANQAEALLRGRHWVDRVSTLQDASTSSSLAPATLLAGEIYADSVDNNDTTAVSGDIVHLADELLSLAEAGTHSITGEETWKVSIELVAMPGLLGNFFPVSGRADGEMMGWLYRDKDKKRRKRALCLRVWFKGLESRQVIVRYLLDFEARASATSSDQTSILFVWHPTDAILPDEIATIKKLIEVIAKNKQTKIPTGQMLGLRRRRRGHPKANGAAVVLFDLFKATDKM